MENVKKTLKLNGQKFNLSKKNINFKSLTMKRKKENFKNRDSELNLRLHSKNIVGEINKNINPNDSKIQIRRNISNVLSKQEIINKNIDNSNYLSISRNYLNDVKQKEEKNLIIVNNINNSNVCLQNKSEFDEFKKNLKIIPQNFISKKKSVLEINCFQILIRNLFCKSTHKTNILDIAINYVKRKISIEEIIRKMLEIDKIKFILFDSNQLNHIKKLQGPNIFSPFMKINLDSEGKIKNSKIDNNDNNKINDLWLKYEFHNV